MFSSLPDEVRNCVLEVAKNLRDIASHVSSSSLREAVNVYLENPGKLIRPALCVLITYILGGDLRRSIYAATALECIHVASLIQDDIIDRHLVRRGVHTPFSRFGPEISMLASNILIAKAIEYSVRTEIPKVQMELVRAALLLTDGAALEIELEKRDRAPTFAEYMKVVLRKTASLIEAAMSIGAIVAGLDETSLERVRILGRLLGLTYQLRDDLVDYLEIDSKNPGRGDKLNVVKVLEGEGVSEKRAIEHVLNLVRRLSRVLRICIERTFGSRADLLMQFVRNIVSSPYNMQFT